MRKTILCGITLAALASSSALANWQDEERVAQQQAIAQEAIEHAEIQTSMMESKVKLFGFAQFRWMYDNISPTGARQGFDVRKAVIGVEGELAEDWSFVLSGEWVPDSSFELRDAYVDGKIDSFGLRAGRFRTAFMQEVLVNEPQLLGNDYSLIAYTFGQGRSEGIQLSREFGDFDFKFAYSNGFETPNVDPFDTDTWGLVGRVDWDLDPRMSLGAALAYNSVSSVGHNLSWTVDGRMTFTDNIFGYASYTGRSDDANGDGWGVLGQAGYILDAENVAFVQYQGGEFSGNGDMLSILSLGLNHYFASNVRWTNEIGYSFNGIDSNWVTDQTGWSNTSRDGQVLFTTQMTISF